MQNTTSLPAHTPLDPNARPWQRRPGVQLSAAAVVVAVLAAVSVYTYLIREDSITLKELLLFPLLIGGGMIVVILLLQVLVCGDRIAHLGLGTARWRTDLLWGLALAAAFLAISVLQDAVGRLLPPRPLSEELIELVTGLARDPWLLALWLGPVVWTGVAVFEELQRVFVLRRLWILWPTGKRLAVLFQAVLFGLAHAYQGPVSAVFVGLMGFLAGWFYLTTGRFWALVVAHGLYDSVGIALAVQALRHGAL